MQVRCEAWQGRMRSGPGRRLQPGNWGSRKLLLYEALVAERKQYNCRG